MSNLKIVTVSNIPKLEVVSLSDLFDKVAVIPHTGLANTVPSTQEREAIKQGFVISHTLQGYGDPVPNHIFYKPSEALLKALEDSPHCGLKLDSFWLTERFDGKLLAKLSLMSTSGICFHYEVFCGFIDPVEYRALKEKLIKKVDTVSQHGILIDSLSN